MGRGEIKRAGAGKKRAAGDWPFLSATANPRFLRTFARKSSTQQIYLKKLTDNELLMSDNELFMLELQKKKNVKVRVQFECAWVKKDEKNQTFTQQIFFLFS